MKLFNLIAILCLAFIGFNTKCDIWGSTAVLAGSAINKEEIIKEHNECLKQCGGSSYSIKMCRIGCQKVYPV